MISEQPYTDLLIRIGAARGDARHPVEAEIDDDSLFFGGALALDEDKLRAAVQNNHRYGEQLRRALFSEPIERAYHKALGIADAATDGRLRLRLQIDPNAARLHALRWERLALPGPAQPVPLSVAGLTPFSRYIARAVGSGDPLSRRPIRMVVFIANPGQMAEGYEPIRVAEEVDQLCRGLAAVQTPGKLQVTLLPGRSGLPKALRRRLTGEGLVIEDGATTPERLRHWLLHCDLLHILSHGMFVPDQTGGSSALLLEQADGGLDIARDDDICAALGDGLTAPRLVFLAACESARRPEQSTEAFVGLGPRLVQAGVAAVIGMQDRVPMDLAQRLTTRFYHDLLDHGLIDQALNDARLPLFDNGQADWSIPVLFTRLRRGRLFVSDPLRTLQRGIADDCDRFFADKQPPLPLDVVRAPGHPDQSDLTRLQQADTPGDPFETAVRALFSASELANDQADHQADQSTATRGQCRIAALASAPGMAKSAHLKYFAGRVAKQALAGDPDLPLVPVFTHLSNFARHQADFQDSFRGFLLDSLRQLSATLEAEQFDRWLADPRGPRFLFLIDGSDRLEDGLRATAWKRLEEFADHHPRHAWLLVCDLSRFAAAQLPIDAFLIAKPLSRPRLKDYLGALPKGRGLFRKLEQASLFDLAAQPWILVRILGQVGRGLMPRSRTGVLQELVRGLLTQIPADKGMRSRAPATLCALAWRMQAARVTVLTIGDAFQVMESARGQREYSLEGLLAALTEQRILTLVGDSSLRFAYPGLQAWFAAQALCAMPDRDAQLDDIDALLRLILFGGRITEGDRVFLAARCLRESGQSSGRHKAGRLLRKQVSDTLVWLSRAANEPRIKRRRQAIRTLGELHCNDAIGHLVSLVIDPVRGDWQGNAALEFSSVRLAAIEALSNMVGPTRDYVSAHHPEFNELLNAWFQEDIDALAQQLRHPSPTH